MVQKSGQPVELDSLTRYLQGFIHRRWCRSSSINRSWGWWWNPMWVMSREFQQYFMQGFCKMDDTFVINVSLYVFFEFRKLWSIHCSQDCWWDWANCKIWRCKLPCIQLPTENKWTKQLLFELGGTTWDWYIYLHEWLIFMVNVGKDTSPMDGMGYDQVEPPMGRWLFFYSHFFFCHDLWLRWENNTY